VDAATTTRQTYVTCTRKPYSDSELSFKVRPEDRYRGIVLSGLSSIPGLQDIVPVDPSLKDAVAARGRSAVHSSKEFALGDRRADFVGRRKRHGSKHWVILEFKLAPTAGVVSQLVDYTERFIARRDVADDDIVEAIVVCQGYDLKVHRDLSQQLQAIKVPNEVLGQWYETTFQLHARQLPDSSS
jgi:hypothetical protein